MGLVILANLWKGKQGEKLDRCILLRVLDVLDLTYNMTWEC